MIPTHFLKQRISPLCQCFDRSEKDLGHLKCMFICESLPETFFSYRSEKKGGPPWSLEARRKGKGNVPGGKTRGTGKA